MTVYLGNAGNIELTRDSGDEITGTIRVADVNAELNMFSFDFSFGAFITGDFVEFRSASTLSFVSGWAYDKGSFFVDVDQLGGLRLYNTYSDAVAGAPNNRVALSTPGNDIAVSCTILNPLPRILGQIVRFELSTDREAVDTTGLGDEFRNRYSTLITGSGRIECIFNYVVTGEIEVAVYLHSLLLRQQFGSDFKAKLYILSEGQGVDGNDLVWYEISGVMTNAAISCAAGDIIGSTFTFVTTGEIKLRVQTTTWGDLLLNPAGDRLVLTSADAALLEIGEDL